MRDRLTFSVTEQEQGKQADWIMKNCLGMSRREISRAKFTENGICVNGQRSRVTARLREGDLLEVLLEAERDACPAAGKQEKSETEGMPPLEILYEDRDVLIINKPAGILTHPVGCHGDGTASDQVRQYLQRTGGNPVARSVGRLDKETSGLLLFARNRMAAARLQEQRKQGKLRKIYLAVVEGVPEPPAGVIHLPLGKAPSGREAARIVVSSSGQEAITEYRVLGRAVWKNKEMIASRADQKDGAASLVACMLQTGRTHQIRVHMAHLGHALVGDCIYGRGSAAKGERALLHAWKVSFEQPFTGKPIQVCAPPPDDFPPLPSAFREEELFCRKEGPPVTEKGMENH